MHTPYQKTSFFLLAVLIIGLSSAAAPPTRPDFCAVFGGIYIEDSPKTADFRVYEDESEAFAEITVYEEENKLFADRKGIWYFTKDRNFADFRIYFTDNRKSADFSVYFTDNEAFAGCN